MSSRTPTLEVTALAHQYHSAGRSVRVYDDIDFQVWPGQVFAVRGESGCGKTTLLSVCGAMQPPTSGSVRIQQQDVFALSPAARTRFRATQIGYLWQTLELLPYLNVFENTCLSHHANRSTARNWLTRLGLEDRLHHKPDALSHGQRQRVALARALSHSPALVIADEPTGNLDQRNSAMVFETLRGFADAGGSVLVASHEDLVDSIADESLLIEHESHAVA